MADLTDEQCDAFRRLPGSFNDMVRAIYRAGMNAATPPADAALADDALCESLIEASDMRWNGDVYIGDGADLMNLVRAALRARAVPVEDICNAYESGVGHNGRPTANVNPYPPGTPQHTAYELGAKGTKHNAPAVPEAVARDAARYRELNTAMFGGEHDRFIVFNNCPETGDSYPMSGEELDAALDAAILSATDAEVKK